MTLTHPGAGFLYPEWQHSTVNVGGALSAIFRRIYPRDTAKRVSSLLDCDPVAAKNLTKGHASERIITKAMVRGGWPVILQLGEALTGRSYEDYLQTQIQEAENARRYAAARADHVRSLEQRAAELVGLHAGQGVGGPRRGADGLGAETARALVQVPGARNSTGAP